MSLQELLQISVAESSPEALSRRLGYRSSAKVMSRIRSIVNSPYMGLDETGFDLRYTTPELILKLTEIAGIPRLYCEKVIEDTAGLLDLFFMYIIREIKLKSFF